ncbi:MAG: tetratricopeptide repeat protein, partial [Deltaproteobacteria bacterium]|nr:tetratricopeptide repeat protein [Deltaproteobacteria bacterium]
MLGVGTSAPGGGIQLGFGAKKGTTPPRVDSGAPRLTDEEEPHTAPMAESPSIKPAGDDARIAGLLDDAITAAGKGDLNRAIQAFTDVLDMRHDRADAHIGRGRCYLELGDYSSAMSDFQRAEDLHPERPDAHVAMGDLYFARKEYRRAIEFYDQAVELDGSHAMARCRRGISHYYRKNYRQAFQDLQRAYSLDPDIPNIRKYVQMAVKKMERPD